MGSSMTLDELCERSNEQIAEALSLVERYDPRDLLSMVAIANGIVDADEFEGTWHSGGVAHIEYAQSLVLAKEAGMMKEPASAEIASRFNQLVGEVFTLGESYYSEKYRDAEPGDLAAEIQYATVLNHLGVRVSSYEAHFFDLLRELFGSHDLFLSTHFDLDIETIITSFTEILSQLNYRLQRYTPYVAEEYANFEERQQRYVEERATQASDLEALYREWEALPEVSSELEEFEYRERELRNRIFRVEPSESVSKHFLELFSTTPGSNREFLSPSKSPGWPGNPPVVESKPLVEYEGEYYCYAPALFQHYAVGILEDLIKDRDQDYFQRRYVPKRAAYLEERARQHLTYLLPGAETYGPLYYWMQEEDGTRNRVETDGVILYDNNVVIVEAKAGLFSDSARRGSLRRMQRDARELVDKAYGQALRTRRYIAEEEVPKFEHEDGSTALVIRGKSRYENFYIVNVTLAHLGPISARLSTLRALDLVRGNSWPWSVFINDLRVISEILDSPSEFLLYLKGRIRANDHAKVVSFSELDFLSHFLEVGLEFEHEHYRSYDRIILDDYTSPLDRYYGHLAGRLSDGQKPRINVPDELLKMVSDLEETGRLGFTEVTTTLLRLGRKTHEDILGNLESVNRLAAYDGKDHDLTMTFSQLDVGLTFLVGRKLSPRSLDSLRPKFQKAMRLESVGRWMLVAIDVWSDRGKVYDFRTFYSSPIVKRKVGRNEPCPCGSGKKYKKCCGKATY